MSKKQIPNILSTIRLLMVPLFAWIFFSDIPNNGFWAVAVFIAAGLTDILDGYLARRNNWITDVGKILDPFADKLMQCTVLICFYIKEIIPIWLMLIYVGKEFLMLVGSLFIFRRKRVVVKSNFFGKMAVCVFYASIAVLVGLRLLAAPEVQAAATPFICIIMLDFALLALVQYFFCYIKAKQTNPELEER